MNKSDKTRQHLLDELQELRSRLMEAEETLRAIQGGEVDGLVVSTAEGDRVFTLSGADHPYRVMVETMNEGAVTLAPEGTILYCNQRFADIVNVSLEKVIGSSIYRYVSSTDLQLFEALIERGLKGNSNGELALKAAGEISVPVLLSISGLRNTDMPGAVCAVMVDITERKKMEETLKISETRYRRLFEAAQDGILILDAETEQIVDVNPFLLEMLGYSHEEVLGKKLWEFGAFRDIEASKATSLELKSKGYVRYHDLPLETKEGRPIAVEFVSNVYLVNHHKVIQCNIRDTTERKLTAEALKKSHNELERQAVELQTALSEIKILKNQLEAENIYFRHESKMKHHFDHIVGESDALKYVLYRAEQVAPANTTVLILGETGTGKELIAAAIHNMSPRKDRPLITVNCAVLPANLMESELFGREKGAFTGADTRRAGRFEVANGSTICLDEIGELPLELQAKLLRVIQHNEFERLGSSHTIKVDVRIVATTNRNLEEEVREGRFRKDLYYRLNVFPITVPPLRQRKEDIPLLVTTFLSRYARKLGKQITSIQKEMMKALQDYPWPGNVRELESVLERAVILCPGPTLQLADKLEFSFLSPSSGVRTLEEAEQNQILKILSECRWRIEGKDGAAAILGLHPSTLRARMHKLGIVRPKTKERD
ncbi:MAG: sigma 54-interacting transcriptional regulator [Desulfatiglandaceae bacterium]